MVGDEMGGATSSTRREVRPARAMRPLRWIALALPLGLVAGWSGWRVAFVLLMATCLVAAWRLWVAAALVLDADGIRGWRRHRRVRLPWSSVSVAREGGDLRITSDATSLLIDAWLIDAELLRALRTRARRGGWRLTPRDEARLAHHGGGASGWRADEARRSPPTSGEIASLRLLRPRFRAALAVLGVVTALLLVGAVTYSRVTHAAAHVSTDPAHVHRITLPEVTLAFELLIIGPPLLVAWAAWAAWGAAWLAREPSVRRRIAAEDAWLGAPMLAAPTGLASRDGRRRLRLEEACSTGPVAAEGERWEELDASGATLRSFFSPRAAPRGDATDRGACADLALPAPIDPGRFFEGRPVGGAEPRPRGAVHEVRIERRSSGYLVHRFGVEGEAVGDTWHATHHEVVAQLRSELGLEDVPDPR